MSLQSEQFTGQAALVALPSGAPTSGALVAPGRVLGRSSVPFLHASAVRRVCLDRAMLPPATGAAELGFLDSSIHRSIGSWNVEVRAFARLHWYVEEMPRVLVVDGYEETPLFEVPRASGMLLPPCRTARLVLGRPPQRLPARRKKRG